MPKYSTRRSSRLSSLYGSSVERPNLVHPPRTPGADKLRSPSMSPVTADSDKTPKSMKNSDGHIPRPTNCFLLFRADFDLKQFNLKKARDSNKISAQARIKSNLAGIAWKNMSEKERAPWREKARVARAEHEAKYPNYQWKRRKDNTPKEGIQTKEEVEERGEGVYQGTSTSWSVEELKDEPYYPPLFLPSELAQGTSNNFAIPTGFEVPYPTWVGIVPQFPTVLPSQTEPRFVSGQNPQFVVPSQSFSYFP